MITSCNEKESLYKIDYYTTLKERYRKLSKKYKMSEDFNSLRKFLSHMHKSYCEIRKYAIQIALEIDDETAYLNSANCRWKIISRYSDIKPLGSANGYVYLISCDKYTKIGITRHISSRFETISTANPFKVELICAIGVQYPDDIENELHNKYIDYNKKGEWFELDDKQINDIKEYLYKNSI